MNQKTKYDALNINDASTSDIIKFAETEAGLMFDAHTSREYMLEQIFKALQWLQKDPTDNATHALIRIGLSPESGGEHAVRLGHNGRMMTVQREVDVEVPIEFYNVLMDINSLGFLVQSLDKMGELTEGSPSKNQVKVTKYPVTVLRFINKGK